MDYPYIRIQAATDNEDHTIAVDVRVQSEFITLDETALAHTVQQWLLDNVEPVTSTTAEHRDQTFPVTPLPPLNA